MTDFSIVGQNPQNVMRSIPSGVADKEMSNRPASVFKSPDASGDRIIDRINSFLRRWVSHPDGFRRMLQDTGSVVTGSAAVELLVQPTDWSANDLDIFAPLNQTQDIVEYMMREEHYDRVRQDEGDFELPPNPFKKADAKTPPLYRFRTFNSIIKLKKHINCDGKDQFQYIDIVESTTPIATDPILHFPATYAMNWIECDRIVCAYPNLTLSGRGINNDMNGGAEPGRIIAWREKYERRGFNPVKFQDINASGKPCGEACWARDRLVGDRFFLILGEKTDIVPEEAKSGSGWSVPGCILSDVYTDRKKGCQNKACENFRGDE